MEREGRRPPRIQIGDPELGRRLPANADATLDESRRDVEIQNLEQRYAEALSEAQTSQRDRDQLAKPEGMYDGKTFISHGQSAKRTGSVPSTPETETEFDWDETDSSDEEERQAVKHAKEEEAADKHRHNVKRAKRLRKVYLACMRVSRPVRTLMFAAIGSGILIIPAIVIWTTYNGSRGRTSQELRDNVKVWSLWLTIVWSSGCGTSLLVDAIPFIASKISILLTGLYPQSIKAKVTLFDGAKFWLKCILTAVWSWISLSVLSDRIFLAAYLDYFRWVIHTVQAIFGSSIVIYVEKLIVQSVKASFHQNALKDRIEENARALWALDKLAASKKSHRTRRSAFRNLAHSRGHSVPGTPSASRPVSRAGSPEANRRNSVDRLQAYGGRGDDTVVDVPLTPNGNPSTYADRPANLRQRSKQGAMDQAAPAAAARGTPSPDLLKGHRTPRYFRKRANSKTIAEQLAEALSTATLKDKSRYTQATQHSAKKMAKRLFEGLNRERDVLIPSDFEPYFATKADAEVAFALFDKDGNGDISKKEMRSAVQRIYRERKALKASLKDMGSAVSKLDGVMLGVCLVIILFIWFLIFDRESTVSSLTSISTIVAALSFIFSNAASTLFNSMIFIFSTQPYSIGDLVFIDTDPLIVKEFGLMSTVFERVDGQYIIAPNSVLSTSKHILNVRRSGAMWETTNVQCGIETSLETITELRTRMRQFVQEESRDWGGGLDINVNTITNQNYIDLIVALQHKGNWQDWGGRWNRRTKLMRHMKMVLDDLQVSYKMPLQRVQLQVRGGPSPLSKRRGSNSSGNTHSGSNNSHGLHINTNFLSADALGNGARMGTRSFQPRDINRMTDASG